MTIGPWLPLGVEGQDAQFSHWDSDPALAASRLRGCLRRSRSLALRSGLADGL